MSGRANATVSAARWRSVWRMHERGMAGRAIARDLGITEGSVRYYLAKGRPADLPRNKRAQLPARGHAAQSRDSHAPNVVPLRRTS